MTGHRKNENRGAVSGWEDDGGAPQSDAGRRTDNAHAAAGTSRTERARVDASHESDTRGEHRYDDAHQTGAERDARKQRDELKQRLEGRATRRSG
jgi:hypothetical protein